MRCLINSLVLAAFAFVGAAIWSAGTKAEAIHFGEVPALAGFRPADGSHLGLLGAKHFTRLLGTLLREPDA